MLHMVIMRHAAESCPGKPGNEEVRPCINTKNDLLLKKGVKTVGRWAAPPAHINYLVLDAPSPHVILETVMESGLMGHTMTEIRPVLSMD